MNSYFRRLIWVLILIWQPLTWAASPISVDLSSLRAKMPSGAEVFELKDKEAKIGGRTIDTLSISGDILVLALHNRTDAPASLELACDLYNTYGMRLVRVRVSVSEVLPKVERRHPILFEIPALDVIFAASSISLPPDWRMPRFVMLLQISSEKDAVSVKASESVGTERRQSRARPQLVKTMNTRPAILSENPVKAPNMGLSGIDAKWSEHGQYLQKMIDAIQFQWEQRILNLAAMPPGGTNVTVKFILNSEGKASTVVSVTGTANEAGTRACVDAIKARASYGAWTDDMKAALGDKQTLTFTFYYQ